MTVRMATRRDEPAIAEILMGPDGLHANNPMGIPYDRETVEKRIKAGTRGKGGIIGVIDGTDGLAASIGLYMLPVAWFATVPGLAELWLYCRPAYRTLGYFDELFGFAKYCRAALANGSGERLRLTTTVVSRERLAAKQRAWAKHAELIGGIYVVDR